MSVSAELERAVAERMRERRFQEALELLDAALALGASPELWNDWATVQHAAGHAYKAEQGYRRALALDPEHRDASVNLGVLLLTQDRTQEAKALLHEHEAGLTQEERTAIQSLQGADGELRERIAGLEAALGYLLITSLNMRRSFAGGEASNRALVESFFRMVRLLRPACFLEIGAHDASTGRRVKAMFPGCDVWGFEANPQNYAAFQPQAAAAGVQYVNLAITGKTGQVTIYAPQTSSKVIVDGEVVASVFVEPERSGRSSLLKRNEEATYREFTVDAVTLDDLMAARGMGGQGRRVALWVDVEGAAHDVLASAKTALQSTAILFIESENHEFWSGQKQCSDVARLLLDAGFLPVERDREYGDNQFNTIFLHHSLIHLVFPDCYRMPPVSGTGAGTAPAAPVEAAGRRKRSYRSLAASLHAQVPVIVPVFNNPSYARNMLKQLARLGFENVSLVDNASSSAEMLAFLDAAEGQVRVIRSAHNHGPRYSLVHPPEYEHLPEIFVVTDPDLEFNLHMPEDFISRLIRATNHFKIGKAGLALRIDDVAQMHQRKFTIHGREYHAAEWELQWWKDEIGRMEDGSPIYRAVTDTTFAVYNKNFFTSVLFYESVRVAGNYTCRHLPWYKDTGLPAEEERLYRTTQKWSYHLA